MNNKMKTEALSLPPESKEFILRIIKRSNNVQ